MHRTGQAQRRTEGHRHLSQWDTDGSSFLDPWLLSWSSDPLRINQKTKIAFVSLWEKEITCYQRLTESGWQPSASTCPFLSSGLSGGLLASEVGKQLCEFPMQLEKHWPARAILADTEDAILPFLGRQLFFCTQRLQSTSQTVHCAAPPWLNMPIGSNISSSA